MAECIFCKIAENTESRKLIYQDDKVVAFDDLFPKAPQHKLIIPRKHIPTINDLAEEDIPLIGHMVYVAKKLAAELGIAESGYRILMNCNKGAGQAIYHIHFHLLGGRTFEWPPG